MKKYLFMAVAGMLALSSCSNDSDELVINEIPQEMTFTAGYPDGEATRAAISGTSVTWESGDKITVFSTKNSTGSLFTTSNTGATATFTGTAVSDEKFYAVYPDGGTSLDGTTIKGLSIDYNQVNADAWTRNQTEATSGLAKNGAFAVAVADAGQALQFKCICAILKVTLNPSGYGCSNTLVKVSATNLDLADGFDYDTATGTITRKTTGNSKFVQAQYVNVQNVSRTLYLKVLPGTYTNFKLLVEPRGGDEPFADRTKTSVTFAAGKVYDLGTYDIDD